MSPEKNRRQEAGGRGKEVLEKNFLWRQNGLRATKFIYEK
jgi:hypothetical protein